MSTAGTIVKQTYDQYLSEHRETHLHELMELMKIKTISPGHEGDIEVRKDAAEWLLKRIQKLHPVAAKLIEDPTKVHAPLVWAHWTTPDPNRPTVLVYCHYDVMPEMDGWTPPHKAWEPQVDENDVLWGRGSCDDKGQLWMQLKAIETLLHVDGKLPVNIKCIFEGEEEAGSAFITEFFEKRPEETRCDAMVISDTDFFKEGVPSITAGLRGLVGVVGKVKGPKVNLHSGLYGGSVKNPLEAVAEIIAALKDEDGVVQVPGFYDDVIPPAPQDRESWAKLPFSYAQYAADLGVPALFGEVGYTTLERLWVRPTLEVNAIGGGVAEGDGVTTIIPSEGIFKITCRLVPNQNPVRVREALIDYLHMVTPQGVTLETKPIDTSAAAVVLDTEQPANRAAIAALEEEFGVEGCCYIRSGGSVPVVKTMQETVGVSPVLLGFGLPDDNIHGPNEHFKLNQFDKGIRTLCLFYNKMATAK